MFDYIDLDQEKIEQLERAGTDALASAGLMIMHGYHKGILSLDDMAKQCHNLFLAILSQED